MQLAMAFEETKEEEARDLNRKEWKEKEKEKKKERRRPCYTWWTTRFQICEAMKTLLQAE